MKYLYKTRPYKHQARVTKRLVRQRGGGVQVPMRYGKSKIGIDAAGALHLLEGIKRVLVVTVVDGVGVWEQEIEKHCAVPWMIDYDYGHSQFPGLTWKIVNYEATYSRAYPETGREWWPERNESLFDFAPELVIVDESHHVGNPTAETHKHVYHLCRQARMVIIMTGSMFMRKPFFIFGQVKCYDPSIFGTAWGVFKERIAVFGGFEDREVKRYKNLKWVMRKIKPWCHIEKYVPPRGAVTNIIPVQLTGANAQAYREMERDAIAEVTGGHTEADIILTKHLRCQQLAGGWAKRTDGKYVRVGSDKLRIAESRISEYRAQEIDKVVIGCRFLPELGDVARTARKVGYKVILFHGGIPKGPNRTRRWQLFNETDQPVIFVAQIQAARESINLSGASTMAYYSLPESYIDYMQFGARIELYEDKRTLLRDHFIATGTRDEVTFEALKEKKNVADFISDDPERVERIVAENFKRREKRR